MASTPEEVRTGDITGEVPESFKVEATLENPDKFFQPFVDKPITQIVSVGSYIFCFREKCRLPMIYGSAGTVKLPGRIYTPNSNHDLVIGAKSYPNEVAWRDIPYAHGFSCGHITFRGPFFRDDFDYDNDPRRQFLPAVSNGSTEGFCTIERLETGEVKLTLSVPHANLAISASEFSASYSANGILVCSLQQNGDYQWLIDRSGSDNLKENFLGTIGAVRKCSISLAGSSVCAVNENGVLRLFDASTKGEIDKFNADDVCKNPVADDEFLATVQGHVYRYKLQDKKIAERTEFSLPASVGNVTDFQCEPRGNFAVVLHSDSDKKGKITIINFLTGEVVYELKEDINCAGPLQVTESGNILFQEIFTRSGPKKGQSTCYRMRSLQTNMAAYRAGEAKEFLDREREIALRVRASLEAAGLDQILAGLEPRQRHEVSRGKKTEVTAVESALNSQLQTYVDGVVGRDGVKSKDIKEARDRVVTLSRQPDYAMFGHIFRPHTARLTEAYEATRAQEIKRELDELSQAASEVDVDGRNGGAVALCEALSRQFDQMEALLREAGGFSDASRIAIPTDIAARREKLRGVLEDVKGRTIEELTVRIRDALGQVQALLATIEDRFILETMWNGELVRTVNGDIQRLPDAERQLEFAEQLKELFDRRRDIIAGIEKAARETKEAGYRVIERKALLELDEIRGQLAVLPDENAIQAFKLTASSVAGFQETLAGLPPERASLIRVQFEDVFAYAIASLEARRSVQEFEGNVVSFGMVKFPRFNPEMREVKEEWRLAPVRTQQGEVMLELKSTSGRTVALPDEILLDPEKSLIMSRAEYQALMRDPESYLRTFIADHPELIPQKTERNVPAASARWEYTEHVERNLEEFAQALAIQKRNQEGITILEGEAGTGKNVLIDIFAHHTNREVFMFTCNAKSDKEDLTRFYDFDPVRGTYRLNSMVVEAILTPGAILVLDEINTLPPEVAKMLNALLDYRRTLFPAEGGRFGRKAGFKADEDVLIVGTMNPQNYAGVQKLSPEVVSRSTIVPIGYPPMQNEAGQYRADEVLMYRKYIPQLASFTRQQFIAMWNAVVNNENRASVDALLTPDIETLFRALKILLVTANKFRKAYMDYKMGTTTEEMDFIFSLREGVNIVQRYVSSETDIKNAVRKVVLPKIWEPQQRARVDAAIIAQV